MLGSHAPQLHPHRSAVLTASNELLARASDGLPEIDETAQKVLDAARIVFATFGLRRTTMEDVARRAGLGRATVYRKFANKEALVERVLLAELQEYLVSLDEATNKAASFDEQVVEGYVTTLRYIQQHSLLQSVVALDGDWGMGYFSANAGGVIAAARDYLAHKMRLAQRNGAASPDFDPAPVAELVVRLCASLMLTPDGVIPYDDDEASRVFARDVLVPIVTRR